MLNYSMPAILGPVGAAEEEPGDAGDDEFDKDASSGAPNVSSGGVAEPRSGAQATATYYAAVQVRLNSE